ncbi:23S rRNA G2445 N2-methylase RlmL [Spinactinospora alkalitolerans]|uniref:23S rRNA G2445 N2-methylase RlmL n=1 Tax=Spinactinospora alkalitolerans TaxID=687207 RepID=A0A852TW04_9ACTN|nr:methyltransferase domain-containing protein [Spinactinospora alkalitolerans]NYE46254.1 23S rRNA G2445 N2-methylase RlmL [Spinactinospora alkalitolerans]
MAVRLMARTLRGLEDIAAREIEEQGLGEVEYLRHREVWCAAAAPDPRLLGLRTVDDLFLLAAVIDGVGHTKADLPSFAELARDAPLRELLGTRRACGGPDTASGVDVAASFLGRRNYNRYDIEDTVGEQVAAALRLPYHSRRGGSAPPKGSASFRVTVEGEQAVLALRIAERPLHRRPYKEASTPGTTHPPLAAAMARLSGTEPGMRVLDPCCGMGTILIESCGVTPGARLLGSDSDMEVPAAAAANAAAAGADGAGAIAWAVADAGRMPVASARIDRVVSNPPWDRQVEAHAALAGHPERFYSEVRRVLAPQGSAVLLLHEAEEHLAHAKSAGLQPRDVISVGLFGARPSIVTLTP